MNHPIVRIALISASIYLIVTGVRAIIRKEATETREWSRKDPNRPAGMSDRETTQTTRYTGIFAILYGLGQIAAGIVFLFAEL